MVEIEVFEIESGGEVYQPERVDEIIKNLKGEKTDYFHYVQALWDESVTHKVAMAVLSTFTALGILALAVADLFSNGVNYLQHRTVLGLSSQLEKALTASGFQHVTNDELAQFVHGKRIACHRHLPHAEAVGEYQRAKAGYLEAMFVTAKSAGIPIPLMKEVSSKMAINVLHENHPLRPLIRKDMEKTFNQMLFQSSLQKMATSIASHGGVADMKAVIGNKVSELDASGYFFSRADASNCVAQYLQLHTSVDPINERIRTLGGELRSFCPVTVDISKYDKIVSMKHQLVGIIQRIDGETAKYNRAGRAVKGKMAAQHQINLVTKEKAQRALPCVDVLAFLGWLTTLAGVQDPGGHLRNQVQ